MRELCLKVPTGMAGAQNPQTDFVLQVSRAKREDLYRYVSCIGQRFCFGGKEICYAVQTDSDSAKNSAQVRARAPERGSLFAERKPVCTLRTEVLIP